MEEYIKDAKNAMTKDKNLRRVYDYEVELAKVAEENGREEEKVEIAKEMKKQGFSLETICSIIKVPMDTLSSWQL